VGVKPMMFLFVLLVTCKQFYAPRSRPGEKFPSISSLIENGNSIPLLEPSSQWAEVAAFNRLFLTHWLKASTNRQSYSSYQAQPLLGKWEYRLMRWS
jgi:hypothetical protein